ncbi:uncharacterized protein LOC144435631 [Glandiceps talaboti]
MMMMQTIVATALITLSVFLILDVAVAYPYYDADKQLQNELFDRTNVDEGDGGDAMWRRAYSPISGTDQSIKDYSSILSCSVGQVCKPSAKTKFSCKCNMFTYCVAPGKYADAKCKWSAVGYVYKQP